MLRLPGQQLADRSEPAQPGQGEEAAAIDAERCLVAWCHGRSPSVERTVGIQWFQENSVVLSRVQNRSVSRSFRSWPLVPASRLVKWASSSGVGRRVSTVR